MMNELRDRLIETYSDLLHLIQRQDLLPHPHP
jgi:hypothetical protein